MRRTLAVHEQNIAERAVGEENRKLIFPATCSTSIIRISPLDLHKEFDSPASYTLVVVAEIDVKRLVFKRNLHTKLVWTIGNSGFEFFIIEIKIPTSIYIT